MRIRVYEAHEDVTKPPSRASVSKCTAEKWCSTVYWKRISRGVIQARPESEIGVLLTRTSLPLPIIVRYSETFDYDYPEQILHPELAFVPALRYPIQLAPQCYE